MVMMSFDPKLPSLGFANGATLYDFTGQHGVIIATGFVKLVLMYNDFPSRIVCASSSPSLIFIMRRRR